MNQKWLASICEPFFVIYKRKYSFISVNTPFFQAQVESLSNTQLNLLKAVATGEKQITSVRVMQDYKLGTSNNIIKNREILIKKDILQFFQGNFEWLDPVFLIWFLIFLV